MRIKNVSSSTFEITIEDQTFVFRPGDINDLSSIDPKSIHNHKQLTLLTSKGLFINLGRSQIIGSKNHLNKTRKRIEKMGLGEVISKKADPRQGIKRNKISNALKDSKKKQIPPKRYQEEYHKTMNPEREYNGEEKPRTKISDKINSVQINPDGIPEVIDFGSGGILEPEVVGLENKFLNEAPFVDKSGNKHQISIEKIKERILRKCVGTSRISGKPCRKYAVHGFSTCLNHMNKEEEKQYNKLKKNLTS